MRKETIIAQFACICGVQSEGDGDPPACWDCGRAMYQWGTRIAERASRQLSGEKADTRTENGGY